MIDLNHIKIEVIALLLFGIVIGLTSIVCANPGVDATPVTHAYSDVLKVDQGYTVFSKTSKISTADQILNGQNIQMDSTLKYDAISSVGTATKTEQITIDGAGNEIDTAAGFRCLFAAVKSTTVPTYCNFATAGSKISGVTLTNTETSASNSFVSAQSDYPVTLGYSITAQGLDGQPMRGTATANMHVFIQEARNGTGKAEDLDYKDTGSAGGLINSFSKTYGYQSGFRLV